VMNHMVHFFLQRRRLSNMIWISTGHRQQAAWTGGRFACLWPPAT